MVWSELNHGGDDWFDENTAENIRHGIHCGSEMHVISPEYNVLRGNIVQMYTEKTKGTLII